MLVCTVHVRRPQHLSDILLEPRATVPDGLYSIITWRSIGAVGVGPDTPDELPAVPPGPHHPPHLAVQEAVGQRDHKPLNNNQHI